MSFGQPMELTGIKAGMEVRDSEDHRLGRVSKVYYGSPYGQPNPRIAPPIIEPYIEVQTGRDDLYVPASSVMEVREDENILVLNVLADRVDEMGFTDKPDFLEQG